MKTALLLRHAKSSWDDPTLPDHERPLNKRGEGACKKIGKLICRSNLVPDIIISSTALRARSTAERVASVTEVTAPILYEDDLYLSDIWTYHQLLRQLDDRYVRPLIIGHNPVMESYITALTGERQRMPTAALAQIDAGIRHWQHLILKRDYLLANLWRPKEI